MSPMVRTIDFIALAVGYFTICIVGLVVLIGLIMYVYIWAQGRVKR